jgi:hypothetical protein
MRSDLLLDLSSVRPPVVQPPASSARLPDARAPRARAFRNPNLQVVLNLSRDVIACDSRHKAASSRKRRLLAGAIEELAALSATFRGALLAALAKVRPPADGGRVLFRTAVQRDVLRTASDLSYVRERHREASRRVARSREKLRELEADSARMEAEIAAMKRRLYAESDLFARFRTMKARIAGLNADFEAMFRPEDAPLCDEARAAMAEKAAYTKLLMRQRAEFEVVMQFSRRVRFYEQLLDEGGGGGGGG